MTVDRKHQIVFYVALPLVLGLIMGGSRAGMGRLMSPQLSLAYWVGSMLLMWSSFGIGSRIAAWTLKPWKPPLWLILLAGAILARFATEPLAQLWINEFVRTLDPNVGGGAQRASAARPERLRSHDRQSRAEQIIIDSGVPYTIIRNGLLPKDPQPPATGRAYLTSDLTSFGEVTRDDLAILTLDVMDNPARLNRLYHAIDPELKLRTDALPAPAR